MYKFWIEIGIDREDLLRPGEYRILMEWSADDKGNEDVFVPLIGFRYHRPAGSGTIASQCIAADKALEFINTSFRENFTVDDTGIMQAWQGETRQFLCDVID